MQETRTDGITDDTNVFQGERVFDSTLGQWTTPDSYGGDINDPATLKAYLYDNNNSQSNQDPSGNDFVTIGHSGSGPYPSNGNPIAIVIGIVVSIATFFGLFHFGGGHAPGPPSQAHPHDPGVYAPHGAHFGVLINPDIIPPADAEHFDIAVIIGSILTDNEIWLGFPAAMRVIGRVQANPAQGSFSVRSWAGYPAGIPRPTGPFRLLKGSEYAQARAAGNAMNKAIRRADPIAVKGKDIHEIHTIKFGGSPTEVNNKMLLPEDQHDAVSAWWYSLQRSLEK